VGGLIELLDLIEPVYAHKDHHCCVRVNWQPGRDGGKAKPLKQPKAGEKVVTDEVCMTFATGIHYVQYDDFIASELCILQ
jgi:hypothetical protein